MKICAIGLRGIPDVMGGIETHCEHLYPRLARLDDELEIIVIGRSAYARTGKFSNVRVVALWAPRHKALEALIHTPFAILYARLFLHPDVVHLHAIGPGFFAPLARLLGFRVIATHHAPDYDRPKWGRFGRWFLKTGEWMLAKFADEVICVSSAIETRLSEQYPHDKERFVTIRNGAPPIVTEAPPADRLLDLFGLLEHRTAFQVQSACRRQHQQWREQPVDDSRIRWIVEAERRAHAKLVELRLPKQRQRKPTHPARHSARAQGGDSHAHSPPSSLGRRARRFRGIGRFGDRRR
jgi:glycosyltransferase involved in cell wall biosynthesis